MCQMDMKFLITTAFIFSLASQATAQQSQEFDSVRFSLGGITAIFDHFNVRESPDKLDEHELLAREYEVTAEFGKARSEFRTSGDTLIFERVQLGSKEYPARAAWQLWILLDPLTLLAEISYNYDQYVPHTHGNDQAYDRIHFRNCGYTWRADSLVLEVLGDQIIPTIDSLESGAYTNAGVGGWMWGTKFLNIVGSTSDARLIVQLFKKDEKLKMTAAPNASPCLVLVGPRTIRPQNIPPVSNARLELINSMGCVVYATALDQFQKEIQLPESAKGFHVITVVEGGRSVVRQKLIL